MQVSRTVRSPNFTDVAIPVRYVVLHFTAAPLTRTLGILTDPATEVSAHLVIDRDGTVYELVECLSGVAKRAWHAGKSRLEVTSGPRQEVIEGFNDFSIGIELVNLNGNIFPYTEAQYSSLVSLIEVLKGLYPALRQPEAIVGHEQIAGFRGKSDPGRLFEWSRLFAVCYPGQGAPERHCLCSPEFAVRLSHLVDEMGVSVDASTSEPMVPESVPRQFFSLLSSLSEAALSKTS